MKARPKLGLVRPTHAALSKAAAKLEGGDEARLVVNMPKEEHRALKAKAAMLGLSIRDYVLGLIRADAD